MIPVARGIAVDYLKEDPKYYDHLKVMKALYEGKEGICVARLHGRQQHRCWHDGPHHSPAQHRGRRHTGHCAQHRRDTGRCQTGVHPSDSNHDPDPQFLYHIVV